MRNHSRAVFWRTGALAITLVGVVQLAWLQHRDALSGRSISSPVGFAQVWSAYRVSGNDGQDWDPQDLHQTLEDSELELLEDVYIDGNASPQLPFLQEEEVDWCSEAEYLDGEWVPRDEEVTMDNIRSIFKYSDTARFGCMARDAPREFQPNFEDPDYYARITEVAQYIWKPKSGCRQHKLDSWNLAKYCLRSKGGCSLVGDSLTDQIWNVYTAVLVNEKDPLFMINPSLERIYNITVNRYHPDAEALANAAGVTMDRLDRPVINYWREHHLVNREELDAVFAGSAGYQNWTGADASRENGWIWPRSWWHARWKWLLGHDISLVPRSSDGVTPEEEHSVLSLSTGPHWTDVEIWPPSSSMDPLEDLRRGYEGVVDIVLQNVTEVAKDNKVLAWWRSNVAAHPECSQYERPENDRTSHRSTKNPQSKAFNWDQFPIYNEYAAKLLGYKPSASKHGLQENVSAMKYLDLWPLSVTRPDAHLKPQADCLHYCVPSVPNEWVNFLWHSMVMAAQNDDYDDDSAAAYSVRGR